MKRSEAIERYEAIARGGITGSFEHVESLFAEAVGRGVPWDPEVDLRPCPNPECVLDAGVELEFSSPGGAVAGCWVNCNDCSLSGPHSTDEAEAIRLWNLLPRTQDEVPARDPGEPGEGELPEALSAVVFRDAWRLIPWRWGEGCYVWDPAATYREAAARWNAVSKLAEGGVGWMISCALQEEREKLR